MSKLKDNSNSILENLDQYDKELLEKNVKTMIDFYNFTHKTDRNDVHSPSLMQKVFEFYKK